MNNGSRIVAVVLCALLCSAMCLGSEVAEDESEARAIQLLFEGMQALDAGDYTVCARLYRRALDATDTPETRFQARLGLATCLSASGNRIEASKVAVAAAQEAPEDPVALHAAGAALLDIGQAGEALPLLEKVVEMAPAFGLGWRDLGRAHAILEANDKAENAFARAIQIDDGDVQAWLGLAVARYQQERYEDALIAFDAAVARDPEMAVARYGRGACRLVTGDEDGARNDARELSDLNTDLAARLLEEINAEESASPAD